MQASEIVHVEEAHADAHRSRWGFHPCSWAVCSKLNLLNKLYWTWRRKLAALERWNRKEPQNRVRRVRGPKTTYVRDGKVYGVKGRVVRVEPLPQPVVPPYVSSDVVEEYEFARTPAPTPPGRKLLWSEAEIDAMLERAQG